ncbi:MAG: type I 3-dehydroquinate dehydratase [Bacteroidales bacterium]|nr:type I 3-dehydroquinate dehydratase [Bacteroidales bacterium]
MICISLAEKDPSQCLNLLSQVEMAEIRLDLVNYCDADIKKIFSAGKKLVATCRPKQYPDEKQMRSLTMAIQSGASYIDIEMEAPETIRKELIQVAKLNECDVILSYHNYSNTPDIVELNKMVEEMYSMGADVAKVATMANDMKDAAKILSLYSLGKRIVALGMGDAGKITRLMAPLFHAEFTFATLEKGKETAPGQVTKDQLIEILNLIKKL